MARTNVQRLVTTTAACVLGFVGSAVSDVASVHADAAESAQYLSLLNDERTSHGLRPLRSSADLAGVAFSWSASMARTHVLAHNPNLTSQVDDWQVVGENVGKGPTVHDLDGAFWRSPEHRANILDSSYEEIGVGSVRRDGVVWITVDFRDRLSSGTARATAPADAPTTPGPAAATSSVESGVPVLRRGVTGRAVRRAQRILAVKHDGVFGRRTYEAAIRFQRRNHLLVDGIVGPETSAALHRASRLAERAARLMSKVTRGLSADGTV